MSLRPDKLGAIMAGHSVDGTGMLPCKEEFQSKRKISYSQSTSLIQTIIILLFVILSLFIFKKFLV